METSGLKLYKQGAHALLEFQGSFRKSEENWDRIINRSGLFKYLCAEAPHWDLVQEPGLNGGKYDPPIGSQEVWAAGVTYLRSKDARMAESEDAAGGSFYDKVYDAARPELFFKSTASKVVGSGGTLLIRRDSHWDVPEPEFTLYVNAKGQIQGYTIGNDVSSRSIEGENPLYLPQAKVYDRSAGLGPCLYVPSTGDKPNASISMTILREDKPVYQDSVSLNMMKRTLQELVEYLFRENSFSQGVYLMTGTGLVPPDDFTLRPQDEVQITMEPVGTLTHVISQRS